jgi:hypothetical protein
VPFCVPIASSGADLAHFTYVRSFWLVSSAVSEPWLASHSFTIGEPCCRMARTAPSLSHSSCSTRPFPSSAISARGSPCRLNMLTIRVEPHVARKAPDGCHAKTTDPRPWYCCCSVKSSFCGH